MDRFDAVVIGAGVIGLAIARALARQGQSVLIAERAADYGTATSARNSEVIHAGLYYPPASLKARHCLRGRGLLYDYLAARHLPHRRCGKLVVATRPDEEPALLALHRTATANGVPLTLLSGPAARALEPALHCTAALLSPETGILDARAFMTALLADATADGALLATRTELVAAEPVAGGFSLHLSDTGSGADVVLHTSRLVNAAGHGAAQVATRIAGLAPADRPQTRIAKGSYFAVPGRPAFSRLIYPLPVAGGLGIHLTLDLAGNMRFGPDVEWTDRMDPAVDPARAAAFADAIAAYWPALPRDRLRPAFAGFRPKLSGPADPAADFRIDLPARHGIAGLAQLFGIESPGLTASLSIAAEVADALS
jgi:L-2-hydroxyglutarate oxidase LhgO